MKSTVFLLLPITLVFLFSVYFYAETTNRSSSKTLLSPISTKTITPSPSVPIQPTDIPNVVKTTTTVANAVSGQQHASNTTVSFSAKTRTSTNNRVSPTLIASISASPVIPAVISVKQTVSENFYPDTKLSPETTKWLSIGAFATFVIGLLLLKGNIFLQTLKNIVRIFGQNKYMHLILLEI